MRAPKAAALTLVLYVLLLIVCVLLLSSAGSAEVGMGCRRGLGDAAEGCRVVSGVGFNRALCRIGLVVRGVPAIGCKVGRSVIIR
jgi:hypothetical protein